MKVLNIILISLLVNCSVFAQFKQGYIIKNNNDTVSGKIDFQGSFTNCKQCSFNSSVDSSLQTYVPGEIKAFRFLEGKYYVTYTILTDNHYQKVFLEWLIKGKASILSYSSLPRTRYFILKDTDSLYELKNTIYTEKIKGFAYEKEKKEYIGALLSLYQDCPSLSKDIENSDFDSKSLIRITQKYNEKTGNNESSTVFEGKNHASDLEFGITMSFLNSHLKLNNGRPEDVNPSNSMGYGFGINIGTLPLFSPKFSFSIAAMFFNNTYSYYTQDNHWGEDDRMCSVTTLKIPWQLVYKFSYKKLTPFVSAGITTNFRFNYTEYNNLLLSYAVKLADYRLGINTFQLGFNAGLGIKYIITPKIIFDLGFAYEFTGNFFGTWVGETTHCSNYFIKTGLYYKFK